MTHETSPRRFMVLGTARSGSTLLCSLLSAHPSIKMYGELFNLDKLPGSSLAESLRDPVRYLRSRLDTADGPGVAAVGFKMFYNHLTRDYFQKSIDVSDATPRVYRRTKRLCDYIDANIEPSTMHQRFRETWNSLIADRRLLVIHLKRLNALHTLISLKRAFTTGQWWSLKTGIDEHVTVRLTPDECERYFQQVDASASKADAEFGTHRKLDLTYEELAEARPAVLTRVFAFLDVPDVPVKTILNKQIRGPARDVVENYSQLQERFRDTRWRVYFD